MCEGKVHERRFFGGSGPLTCALAWLAWLSRLPWTTRRRDVPLFMDGDEGEGEGEFILERLCFKGDQFLLCL